MSASHILPLIAGVVAALQNQRGPETLQALAVKGPDSALVAQARERPDEVRDALHRLFVQAAADSQAGSPLAAAERLARDYAAAWGDSFPVRQVARFEAWSPAQRRLKVGADSLRLAGNAAFGRAGAAAALRFWRESLRRCEALADSAGVGAALGNVGEAFHQSGDLDSAAVYFSRARSIAALVGDHRTEGNAIGALATLEEERGELRQAADLYARAAAVRPVTGDDRGAAADRNNAGLMALRLGDFDAARQAFSAALVSNRQGDRDEAAALNLVNLGNLAGLEGDYPRAAVHYREALGLFEAHDNRVGAAKVLHDLGLLELQRGEYRAALSALTRALELDWATGSLGEEIGVRRDIATAHAAMGNLQGASIQLERAERIATAANAGGDLTIGLALTRADLAVQFNSYAEAEAQYTRAARLAHHASDRRSEADAERGLGLLLVLREDYPRAQARLEQALRADGLVGDARSVALTRLLLGYVQESRGDTAGARGALTRALAELQAVGDGVSEAAALGALGDLDVQAGSPLVAESLYRRGLRSLGEAVAPSVAWPLHAGLAQALESVGARDRAALELRAAVREIERVSGTLPLEERRAAFLADKWDVYGQLARVELDRGQIDSAFETSERLRARELLDFLARGRVAAEESESDTLAAREQDLRRQMTALTRQLEGAGPGSGGLRGPLGGDVSSGAVREALARVQDAYALLLRRVREERPEYAALVTGQVAPVREVMRALDPDQALLEYLVGDSTSVVFVITADTAAAIDLGVSRHELATLVDFSRGVLVRPAPSPGATLWRAPLQRLYRYLIQPVEAARLLGSKHELLIVPHAELHYAPFAALLDPTGRNGFLIQRYRIAYAPSASIWLRLHERRRATVSGVLAMAPRPEALPGSAEEVNAIGRLFGARARVLLGAGASKRALIEAAPEQGVIHLATYGVLNKDNPLFSFVELMPEGGDDGRLEVHDVFGMQLRARLVVLSACQTGLGSGVLADVPAGDDWVGLNEAFLFAGASHVMATLWPVQDEATAGLMTRFYGSLATGKTEAEALAEAQRETLRHSATAHPFYWAGFTLSGGQ